MTINAKSLKQLLNIKEEDIKHYSIEQLRDMLGVFHYLSRVMQREINQRTGGKGDDKSI